jgi:hypothetical protein
MLRILLLVIFLSPSLFKALLLGLQQHNTNAASLGFIGLVLSVDSPIDWLGPPIVKIVMQLSVASTELQLLEEQRVVMQSKSIEDVKLGLFKSVSVRSL